MTTAENLTAALASVQAALPHINKGKTATVRSDKGNYSYSYADLSDVASAIHPLLGAAGLAFVACPTLTDDGRFVLAYSLRHISGESIDGAYPLPDPAKGTPQQIGSAITYARRYTLCSVSGVVPDEDDDGAAAQNTTAKKADRIRKPAQPVVDEWTAPEGETPPTPASSRKTDEVWLEGWLGRVMEAGDLAMLPPLREEAAAKYREGAVTKADAEQVAEALKIQADLLERANASAWPEVAKPADAVA